MTKEKMDFIQKKGQNCSFCGIVYFIYYKFLNQKMKTERASAGDFIFVFFLYLKHLMT